MRKFFKKYGGVVYIAVVALIVLVVLTCMEEPGQIVKSLHTLRVEWVVAAGGCVVMYLFLRAFALRYYLQRNGFRVSWPDALEVTGTGQFYAAITPSASGGQPMQVLSLHRKGVPTSLATACISVKFLGFQTAVLAMGAILWMLNATIVEAQLHGLRWLVALGFVVNGAMLLMVALTIPRTRVLDVLLKWVVKIGAKLHVVKRPEEALNALRNVLEDYREALLSLFRRPIDALVMLGVSLLQVLIYMSVVICIYQAFGFSETNGGELLTLQFLLFIAAAFMPLPGSAGAQESGFFLFFQGVFPEESLTAAMLCWRSFTYYLLLLAGLALMATGSAVRFVVGQKKER